MACLVAARTLQGMARVRSGQAPAWPLVSGRSVRRGSRVKRDFACTSTSHDPPVLVALRSQSRLRLEGRTRTLSGPSPDLRPPRTLLFLSNRLLRTSCECSCSPDRRGHIFRSRVACELPARVVHKPCIPP